MVGRQAGRARLPRSERKLLNPPHRNCRQPHISTYGVRLRLQLRRNLAVAVGDLTSPTYRGGGEVGTRVHPP